MILVTGAGGFVGRHLVARLVADGRPVRAMVRDRTRAPVPAGAEVVEADLTRPQSLAPALAEVEAVVHTAAITADRKEPYRGAYDAVNRQGTEHLVAAAAQAGVRRLVAMSGLGARPAPPGTYMATRWGLEEAIRRSGLPHVILQPSVLFGRGAPFVEGLAGVVRRAPVVPVLGRPDLLFQPLWVEDLCRCLIQALEDESLTGKALPLGGAEQVTNRQMLEAICRALRKRRLLLPVPLALVRPLAALMTASLPRPPLTPAALELFERDNITDPDSVERAFGFRPRGFLEYLREHGLD